MNRISFFTPVSYGNEQKSTWECLIEKVDSYFYLGGKKATVISGQEGKETRDREVTLTDNKASMISTALKIISYLTIVLPLIMLVAKAILRSNLSSNYNFILKKQLEANEQADPSPAIAEINQQLANKIIAQRADDPFIKRICSEGFLVNPIDHLVKEMIERGVGLSRVDDNARAFVIGQIPDFIQTVGSVDYLRAFASRYFKKHPKKHKVMAVFEDSLGSSSFQRDLHFAVNTFHLSRDRSFEEAEGDIRIMLSIYPQSSGLQPYITPIVISE